MRKLLWSAVFVLGLATVLSGNLIIDPSDEALATMMGSQEGITSYLMRRFGLLTNTLTFESQFTDTQFQYSLVSGSLYGTFPIEFAATGTQTSPGHWTVTGTGVVIDPPIFPDSCIRRRTS
jgi:hypothetical protein